MLLVRELCERLGLSSLFDEHILGQWASQEYEVATARFVEQSICRRLALAQRIKNWSMVSLQHQPVKTAGRLISHARYY